MRIQSNNLNLIWRVFNIILLIVFLIFTINWLAPSSLRFPNWLISSSLEKRKVETEAYTRIDYVDQNDVITLAVDKNYATVLRTKDVYGNYILEEYFDEKGAPVELPGKYSVVRREYDKDGNPIKTEYLDQWMKPVIRRDGYSVVLYTYSKYGKVETEMYFDEEMQPTRSIMNRYGVRYQYTPDGKETVAESLDVDGELMTHTDNYAIVKKTYSPNGKLHTVMYYDGSGNTFDLGAGVCGYLYEGGKTCCLDSNGNKFFSLSYYLFHSKISVIMAGIILFLLILLSTGRINLTLLLAYLAFIVYMTILNRTSQSNIIYLTLPPNAYLFFTNNEIMMNIWLFVPLGAILYKLFRMWKIIVIPIVITLVIETMQIVYGVGAFELTDIIANSLGGVIGIAGCYVLEPIVMKIYERRLYLRSSVLYSNKALKN